MHCIKIIQCYTGMLDKTFRPKLELRAICKKFRAAMPSPLSRGRRFPRELDPAAVSAWCAEECLVYIRLGWRHYYECIAEILEDAGDHEPH